jgi:hypothetical protein
LAPTDGVIDVTVGAATTVRHPLQVEVVVSGSVTVTEYDPGSVAVVDLRVAVTVVAVTTTDDTVSVTVVEGPVTLTVAPETKPAPDTVNDPDAPMARSPGLTEVIPIGTTGTTELEAAEDGPVPIALVASTVKS